MSNLNPALSLLQRALAALEYNRHAECTCPDCYIKSKVRWELVFEIQQYLDQPSEDPRKTGLKNGLRQLSDIQIQRLLDYPGELILDDMNYIDGKFCPLAVAVGLHETLENPTDIRVSVSLMELGLRIYNTRNIPGEFYTTNRLEDLKLVAREILAERVQI